MKDETTEEKIERLERENAAMLSALKNANENDMVIRLLIAAGHVHEDTVEKARELANDFNKQRPARGRGKAPNFKASA